MGHALRFLSLSVTLGRVSIQGLSFRINPLAAAGTGGVELRLRLMLSCLLGSEVSLL